MNEPLPNSSMKDYYKIMNVPYDASAEDIRRAYHRFAKKYHPDKNGSQDNTTLFLDIQEAYHTLSNEQRRHIFHLKTHYPLPGSKRAASTITSETILQQCRQLYTGIRNSNRHQLNPAFIADNIAAILSEKNIRILLAENKVSLQENIAEQLLPIMKLLPYRLAVSNISRLLRLAANNASLQQRIIAFGNSKRRLRYWEKYNLVIVLTITLLICAFIVLLSE